MAEKGLKGLIALDLDGTFFNNEKRISERNRQAIQEAIASGYCVVPVTGRPISGIPKELMEIREIGYAVASNGAVIYEIEDFIGQNWKRISEDMLSDEKVLEVLEILKEYPVVPDCFVQGVGHMPEYGREWIPKMGLPQVMADYLLAGREFFPDLMEYVRQKEGKVEKITINFYMDEEGIRKKQEVYQRLMQVEDITLVSGAPHNLEVNTVTARKGNGMLKLAKLLGIAPEKTMACGDDINDMDMVVKAGFGVAMGNASEELKKEADFITLSNEEDGAAIAIYEFIKRIQG